MYCYGRYADQRESCGSCGMRGFCRDAGDLPLLSSSMPSYNDEIAVPGGSSAESGSPAKELYSRNDLLEVISFMLQLDSRTVELLAMHVSEPGITFRAMAESRKVSKQAVHKFLKNQCRKFPEIAALLRVGERRRDNNKNKTFMEAVCLIRRKTCALRSKSPRKNSLCWRKLICSTESSSSLNTNIIKGAGLWLGDSR